MFWEIVTSVPKDGIEFHPSVSRPQSLARWYSQVIPAHGKEILSFTVDPQSAEERAQIPPKTKKSPGYRINRSHKEGFEGGSLIVGRGCAKQRERQVIPFSSQRRRKNFDDGPINPGRAGIRGIKWIEARAGGKSSGQRSYA